VNDPRARSDILTRRELALVVQAWGFAFRASRSLGEQHQRCGNWWRPLGEDGKLPPEQAMSAAINNPGFETHFDEKMGSHCFDESHGQLTGSRCKMNLMRTQSTSRGYQRRSLKCLGDYVIEKDFCCPKAQT